METRKNNRLSEYDYGSIGAYFITVCVKDKQKILSHIVGDGALDVPKVELTHIGKIVNKYIRSTNNIENVTVDKYVIMPNHVHMIIVISETEGINPFPTIKYDIPNVVGKFKAAVTRVVGNAFMHSVKNPIWQSSFHDHIIRGEKDYQKIWEYIDTNVIRWENDCFYNSETEQ